MSKPTVSEVVRYLESKGIFEDPKRIRSKVTYRGYRRNLAKKMRKFVK